MLHVEASSVEVITGMDRVWARVRLILPGSLLIYVRISYRDMMRDCCEVRNHFKCGQHFKVIKQLPYKLECF
jgi:hypothetical protein